MTFKVTDMTNPACNPMPEEVQDLVAALLEGRVKSMFLVAELVEPDGETAWIEGFELNMDEHQSNQRAFIGAVTLNLDELKQGIIEGEFVDIELDDDELNPGLDSSEDDDDA